MQRRLTDEIISDVSVRKIEYEIQLTKKKHNNDFIFNKNNNTTKWDLVDITLL